MTMKVDIRLICIDRYTYIMHIRNKESLMILDRKIDVFKVDITFKIVFNLTGFLSFKSNN